MDCLILAGDKKNYLQVDHQNKAFLTIDDRSILEIMLAELSDVEEIERFVIVGPKQRLSEHLSTSRTLTSVKPIVLIEQADDLVGNIVTALKEISGGELKNDPVLILPSDTPLLIAEELRAFIAMGDMDRYDYVGGISGETVLSRFYPSEGKPGLHLGYFYCEGEGFRINNLHMVRPLAFGRSENIRRVYSLRYQKRFKNAMQVIWVLFKQVFMSPGAVLFYLGLNIIYWMQLSGLNRLAVSFSKRFSVNKLSHFISRSLETRMNIVLGTHGGSTLDVDNDEDLRVIRERFDEWLTLQRNLYSSSNS